MRIIRSAIHAFSAADFKDVSLAAIAEGVGLVPQAFYRYFANKSELFEAAWIFDVDEIHHEVLAKLAPLALPSLTGDFWKTYQASVESHPLAKKVMASRQSDLLDKFASLVSTAELMKKIESDLVEGQRLGILRQDQNFSAGMRGAGYLTTHVLMPLIFEGKYMGADWQDAVSVLVGNMFYPIPDLSTPENVDALERKMSRLISQENL